MHPSPNLIRLILSAGILALALLAAFYLRQRQMPLRAYLAWGLLALFLPILGPFLVIWVRPGCPQES